jgi:hypothetical protein
LNDLTGDIFREFDRNLFIVLYIRKNIAHATMNLILGLVFENIDLQFRVEEGLVLKTK